METKICSQCGAILEEGQEFCAMCGQKVGVDLGADVSSAIAQFNESVTKKKKRKGPKIALCIIIPCLIIAAILVASGTFKKFGGTYVYVAGENEKENSYIFEDEVYEHKSGDETEKGTYKKEKKILTTKDEEGEKKEWIIEGDYICDQSIYFDQKIDSGHTVNQTFEKMVSTEYKGSTMTLIFTLKLSSDGTYSRKQTLEYGTSKLDIDDESGRYRIKDGVLTLTPNDEDFTRTYLIINDRIYYQIYKKK